MKYKNPNKKEQSLAYTNSIKRMERWHLCQKIGVLYYEAHISFDKLRQIEEYFATHGVVE